MSGNTTPVIAPSTCEEPIYQETPGATIPAATPEPYCPTPTPAGPYPVPVETTATTVVVVSELPGTGTGETSGTDWAFVALIVGLIVVFAVVAYLTVREPWHWPGEDED